MKCCFSCFLAQRIYSIEQNKKEEFAKSLDHIISEESTFSAIKVLEESYNRITDQNSALIAQTISRLHISKTQNFDKAIEWAEKADKDWPNNFAIVDTSGNAFKNKFKARLAELVKTEFTLANEECEQLLSIAQKAIGQFKKAAKLVKQKRERHDEEIEDSNPILFTGIFGEIETNLKILEMLMKSINLADSITRQIFFDILTNIARADLDSVFPKVSWSWEDYYDLIISLWFRTLECLQEVTGKLNYFNYDPEEAKDKKTFERLGRFFNEFENIFGPNKKGWKIVIKKTIASIDEKVEYLRSYLKLKCVEKFRWSLMHLKKNQLQDVHERIEQIRTFCSQSKTISMNNNDKLCHINVLLCGHYSWVKGILKWTANFQNVELVNKYCLELVVSQMDIPEPYLFYLMMAWPSEENDYPSIFEENLLVKCLGKLTEFLNRKNPSERSEKLIPVFSLAKTGRGLQRLRPYKHLGDISLI